MKTITIVVGLALFIIVSFSYLAWVGSQLGAQLRMPGVQLSYVPLMEYMTPNGALCYDTGIGTCTSIFGDTSGRLIAFLSRTQIPRTPSVQLFGCYDQEHRFEGRPYNTYITDGRCPSGYVTNALGYLIQETSDPALPALRSCEIDGRTYLAVNSECGGPVLGHTPLSGGGLVQAYDLCGRAIAGGAGSDFEHRRGQLETAGWCGSRWQNHPIPWDVNRDGEVNDRDQEAVQAALSSEGEHDLPSAAGESVPPPFIDVNGDFRLTTADLAALTDGVVPETPTTPPATNSWQNSNNRFDVNNDGNVNSFDILQVMSYLSQQGEGELAEPSAENTPPPFVDVNGDGIASRADADEIRAELSKNKSNRWHNVQLPADVNNDGTVNSSDMLVVFRELQNGGAKRNDQLDSAGRNPPPYLDTTNDGQVNSNDVDFVLRAIRQTISDAQ